MRKIIIRAIVLVALAIGFTTLAKSQEPQARYQIDGQYLRNIYANGMTWLESGNYIVAYRFLSTYNQLEFGLGVFNQNPQFREKVQGALNNIETYYKQAVSERQELRRQLLECRQSAQGSVRSQGYGLSVLQPNVQLPRVPPTR